MNMTMTRPRIDKAIHAQLDRLAYLLRDVDRSGGLDTWSHLFSHGHRFPTIKSAIRQGYLKEAAPYHYALTDDAREFLSARDIVAG